ARRRLRAGSRTGQARRPDHPRGRPSAGRARLDERHPYPHRRHAGREPMRRVILALSLLGCGLAGCSQRPAWNDEPQAATLAYWIEVPATARVESGDYRALWDA